MTTVDTLTALVRQKVIDLNRCYNRNVNHDDYVMHLVPSRWINNDSITVCPEDWKVDTDDHREWVVFVVNDCTYLMKRSDYRGRHTITRRTDYIHIKYSDMLKLAVPVGNENDYDDNMNK